MPKKSKHPRTPQVKPAAAKAVGPRIADQWHPSNLPFDYYDEERVARLRPIENAIEGLKLPLLRTRKLRTILSAVEVQIEDGGDSPTVNELLLAALREGVLHQVDEPRARSVLRAIDAFERDEARRWEQVRSGTLPPHVPSESDQLDELMQDGYDLLQSHQTTAACDRWLAAWEIVKHLARPEMKTVDAFDQAYPDLEQSVFNWSSDLEMELGNAGLDDSVYHERRLQYSREFLAQFPDEDANRYVNMLRAQGEALWHLGRSAEAEAVYAALVERLPDEGWAYIGWADNYWLLDDSPKEYATAEAILQRALARPALRDRGDVLERLEELQKQRDARERRL